MDSVDREFFVGLALMFIWASTLSRISRRVMVIFIIIGMVVSKLLFQ